MDGQPGQEDGEGAGPDRDPGPPSPGAGGPVPRPGRPGRDPRLAEFAWDESREAPAPSARLALLVDELSGPERRCPGADDDEQAGLLRAWAAIESWAAGGKLGVIRGMMRRDGAPSPGGDHGDLPETWSASLRYELAGALACSTRSAESAASLAWELRARLPGIGARLEDGTLTQPKARAIAETFLFLLDADAAAAEAMIIGQLRGKTYAQVLRLAEQAALTVDPAMAGRRREQAQRKSARVSFFREQAGTAALSGRDLPPDEALAAMASVNARAGDYKESGAFGDTPMDVLRAYAYLDLINGVPAAGRIAAAERQDDAADAAESLAWAQAAAARAAEAKAGNGARPDPGPGADEQARANPDPGERTRPSPDSSGEDRADPSAGEPDAGRPGAVPPDPADLGGAGGDIPADPDDCSCAECDGSCLVGDYDLDLDDEHSGDDDPEGDDPGDDDRSDGNGPDGSSDPGDDGGPDAGGPGSGGPGPRPGAPPTGDARQRRPADLIVPLATLLGLAERPGEIHGFGLLDAALARELAAAAAASPRTEVCVTVTSGEGYAIGHGCARPPRAPRPPGPAASLIELPARLNLTIPATALPSLAGPASRAGPGGHAGPASRAGPGSHAGPWAFAPGGKRAGTPGGFGTWTLTLPGGRDLTVRLDPVPTFSCDHRYESHGYQPSDRLRHLVQIRDGTCTFPPCNRHAHESDFEHAVPYDQGGKTCTCNAGARSRACHRVKQTRGWEVTQPRPGWHRWQTPAGRVYIQEPKRYPA
jgi:Domain of unknown function (DUF222)